MLVELTKHIKLIRPEALAVYPYSNSIYIDDEVAAIIDAGAGGRAYGEIDCASVAMVLLSHYHFDHYNGVSFFPNARKMMGTEELVTFQNEAAYTKARGYDRWPELMGTSRQEEMARLWQYPDDIPTRPDFGDIRIDEAFQDGQVIEIGTTKVQVIHTPGHTSGHYAFYFPHEEILFSGDYDASGMGPWYGDAGADIDDMINSVEKLISFQPRILVGSHRRPLSSGIETSLRRWLDIALQREFRMLEYLAQPRSLDDMRELGLFKKWDRGNQHSIFWEKMMLLRHLKRMEKQGRVAATGDGRYVRC